MKPAESLTLRDSGDMNHKLLRCKRIKNLDLSALFHKTQGLHHVQELGVRVMPLGTSDSPDANPTSELMFSDFCGVASQGLMQSGRTSNQQSITSPFSCRGPGLLCIGEFMIKTEWLRKVGNICTLWEGHVSYGHGYRSRLGTPINVYIVYIYIHKYIYINI